jgi:hypothetical protein
VRTARQTWSKRIWRSFPTPQPDWQAVFATVLASLAGMWIGTVRPQAIVPRRGWPHPPAGAAALEDEVSTYN